MARSTFRARQQERSRAEIVASTLEIIAADGLPAVSVDAILRTSGMARATLYAHFPGGRDEVLQAAYALAGERLLDAATIAVETRAGWRERMTTYARTMIEYSSSPGLGHFYSISGPHLMGFRTDRGVGAQGYYQAFKAALGDAQEGGELVTGADIDSLSTLLVSSLRDGGIAVAQGQATVASLVTAFEILLRGLTRPS